MTRTKKVLKAIKLVKNKLRLDSELDEAFSFNFIIVYLAPLLHPNGDYDLISLPFNISLGLFYSLQFK